MHDSAGTWEARARAWAMFARLVAAGPADPVLAAAGLTGFAADPDEAAADHHRWLAFEILPWESVFLTEDRLLGGDRAAAVAALTGADDHLAAELGHLARLCAAIATAEQPAAFVARLERFSVHHLGPWLPLVAHALADVPGYGAALALAVELLASHSPDPVVPPEPSRDPLAGNLRGVADWLATPLATGTWWTHREIDALADELGLPCGFGARTDRLAALLQHAADHRRAADAARAIGRRIETWNAHWRDSASPWAPRSSAALATWSTVVSRIDQPSR